MTIEQLKNNYEEVLNKVEAACIKASRDKNDVTVIAVSKTKPLSMVEDAISAGMTHFGENKPQEIRDKTKEVSKDVHWHMIGKLQSNKIKYVIETCELIHSVDSIKLAKRINSEAIKRQCHVNILIQVNITGEESKSGFSIAELYDSLEFFSKLEHVHVQGLMTIPPFVDTPEDNRLTFRQLNEVFVDIKSKNIDNITMSALSMGMTVDYEVAVEEGATYIRVGTGIFGERNYK
jgi:hypothetical protein